MWGGTGNRADDTHIRHRGFCAHVEHVCGMSISGELRGY